MKVKICGITRREDAEAAVEAGADALGFIFTRSSPRFITPEDAAGIVRGLPPFVTPVGVVVNASRAEVFDYARVSGVRALQFHGEETPADVGGFGLPVIKAFRVGADFDPASLSGYAVSAYLLDAFDAGRRGGTGRTFPWEIAVRAGSYGRVILSGGLNPGNIAEAARVVQPYACDVSSGVESAPGRKDPGLLRLLFDALRTIT
jgi:phosphoribosylanthranilate isomerase